MKIHASQLLNTLVNFDARLVHIIVYHVAVLSSADSEQCITLMEEWLLVHCRKHRFDMGEREIFLIGKMSVDFDVSWGRIFLSI